MKPAKVFAFLLFTFLALAMLAWLFPDEGIQAGRTWRFRFPGIREILELFIRKEPPVSIHVRPPAAPDTLLFFPADTLVPDLPADTVSPPDDEWLAARSTPDSLRRYVPGLQFPEETDTLLFPFFRKLERASNSTGPLHILHYGDSQIEGDRISSYLRQKLQSAFGGGGIGWFPATMVVDETVSFRHTRSANWQRTTFRDLVDSTVFQRRLGFLMSRSFLHAGETSTQGRVNIRMLGRALTGTTHINRAGICYGNADTSFVLHILADNEIICLDTLPPSTEQVTLKIRVNKSGVRNWEFRTAFPAGTEWYGFSLEDSTGVMVNNIPLRGSSGLEFSRLNTRHWKSSLEGIHTGLIILQFGINLVPGLHDQYTWYEKRLASEIDFLRKQLPGVPVIVIGVTDMAMPSTAGPQTYPNVLLIREAQWNAAMKSGAVFWDSFMAMGGEGSIVRWSETDPPLARTDYTHFTYSGSRLFAELFYTALMKDYQKYTNNKK